MKIVVLGGYGVMGSSVVRDLVKGPDVERIIIAGRHINESRLHESIRKNHKVTGQIVDISDYQALIRLIKGNDVVINCVGPFYKFAIPTMKAAIEARVHYLDIMDDYDTTQAAFDLDKTAKDAGVAVCIGYGSSPGFGNIVARYAANKLDRVEEIRLLWGYAMNDPAGPSVLAHMFHALRGDVPQFLDGKLVYIPGGSGGEEVVDFGEKYGKCPVYYLGHPEPITMPRYFQGIKTVVNKGCFLPLWVNSLFLELLKRGFGDTEPIGLINNVNLPPESMVIHIMQSGSEFRKLVEESTTAPLNVVVKGTIGNKKVTYVYSSDGRMAPGTAIPASICAQMLARGEIKGSGILPPEACVDPVLFLSRFAQRGFRLHEQSIVAGEVELSE